MAIPIVKQLTKLQSAQDRSVNFIAPSGQESRYVRRTDDYFIVYISSHNGCNLACRVCHLTQSGQTAFVESSVQDMLTQAALVLDHYKAQIASGAEPPAQRVNFNWMARGEPLASSVIRNEWAELTRGLAELARDCGLEQFNFNVSSIFPTVLPVGALMQFGDKDSAHLPRIYYSLYSLDPSFRKRWFPKAMAPQQALDELAAWQRATGGEVIFHWAMIAGENDRPEDISAISEAIRASGIRGRFNLVRYNPFSERQGVEPDEATLQARFAELSGSMLVEGSRIVPRVGFDVKASCGMFVLAAADPV